MRACVTRLVLHVQVAGLEETIRQLEGQKEPEPAPAPKRKGKMDSVLPPEVRARVHARTCRLRSRG